jgi:hypothetical protein
MVERSEEQDKEKNLGRLMVKIKGTRKLRKVVFQSHLCHTLLQPPIIIMDGGTFGGQNPREEENGLPAAPPKE